MNGEKKEEKRNFDRKGEGEMAGGKKRIGAGCRSVDGPILLN